MLDAKLVGNVIQKVREQKGLSQEVVSGLADIGRTHLSAIERGERKPTLETFFRISDALDIKPSELIAKIEDKLNG
ncbi:MAG: helix-turn-helix transcriptional regulator [Clostridia bacterium]|nr:helix-turn-helix transcriptional regulator [Clostridia bacterium]